MLTVQLSGFISGNELQQAATKCRLQSNIRIRPWGKLFDRLKINMKETIDSKVVVGQPPCQVKFNFGVVGATGVGKRTFTKALTEPYDLIGSDYQVNVISEEELTVDALKNKHSNWNDECKIPTTDEIRHQNDKRVHCIFYLFVPHQILAEDKKRIQQLLGLAPIVPVLAKADAMTLGERHKQLRALRKMMREVSSHSTLPTFFDFKELGVVAPDLMGSTLHVPRKPNIFAVICDVTHQGQRVYPWGTVDTHNESWSDLRRLQCVVFESGSITRLRALTQQMSIQHFEQNQKWRAKNWEAFVSVCNWLCVCARNAFFVHMDWVKRHRDAGDELPFLLNAALAWACMLVFGRFEYGFLLFLKLPFELWWFHTYGKKQKSNESQGV